MSVLVDAEQYAIGRLAALVSGRVYSRVAPPGAVYPLIIVQEQSPGVDLMVVGAARLWTDPLLLAKAVDRADSWSTLAPIADAIDAALHDTAAGTVWSCVRERPFSLVETPNGVQYRHLGGFYRLQVS